MFSTGSALVSASLRNPRHNGKRPSDDSNTAKGNQRGRKRPKLTEETFQPLLEKKAIGHQNHINGSIAQNGHVVPPGIQRDASVDTTSLAFRRKGTKWADRDNRGGKLDDSVLLTKNENYTVTQLPDIPEPLRDILSTGKWQASISSTLDFAVALTTTQAILWRYRTSTSASNFTKPLILKIPHNSRDFRHALPIGVLSKDPGTGELALLVVMPSSGKVVYWDSVSNAANADAMRLKEPNLQGIVSGSISGETITKAVEAESGAFFLTSSIGRIIHLSVKDSQGRPQITTYNVEVNAASNFGLLGGIRRAFTNALWQKNIAAVKTRRSRGKNHCSCVVATTKGLFQVWDTIRNSTQSLSFEVDAKVEILKSIGKVCPKATYLDEDAFSILDFVLFPGTDVQENDLDFHRLLVLTAHKTSSSALYTLLDLTLRQGTLDVDIVHPITCFSELLDSNDRWKPQIFLPLPAQTAVVVFPASITLVSLAKIEESPESQIRMESHSLPGPFQDTIYFRQQSDYYVTGCTVDEPDRNDESALCTLLVHGYGLVQVAISSIKAHQTRSRRIAVTAKSKMEQAIFFGHMPHNLLDLSGRTELVFKSEDVETAALEINDSIMQCTSAYTPAITAPTDQQLKLRSTALAELIMYIQRFKYPLRQDIRWKLLWDAEKMAAARALWHSYNKYLSSRDPSQKSLLPELLDMMSELKKVENRPECGETDIVRHYLFHDVWRIELVVPWAEHAIEELHKEGVTDNAIKVHLVAQADEIQISVMEAAFRFRSMNATLYGIEGDLAEDGILQIGYEELSEPWTSTPLIVEKVKQLVDVSREIAYNQALRAEDEVTLDEVTLKNLGIIRQHNPRLVDISCRVFEERFRYLKAQPEPQRKAEGEAVECTYLKVRRELILKLVDLLLPEEAVKLAIRYQDMPALADVLFKDRDEHESHRDQQGMSESEAEEITTKVEVINVRMKSFFTTFGTSWANAYFSKLITRGNLWSLIDSSKETPKQLTKFLRDNPEYARLRWINEILSERSYTSAADTLFSLQKKETDLWSRRIELSMGKLALLAAEETMQPGVKDRKRMKKVADRNMEIITIQERLDAYVRSTVRGAIDEDAALQIAMEMLCQYPLKNQPTLYESMRRAFEKLLAYKVLDIEELINMLSTIDFALNPQKDEALANQRFFLALTLLKFTDFAKSDPGRIDLYEKIIWRRCLIHDNWETINHTEHKNDSEVALITGATALFQTLRASYEDGTFKQINLVPPVTLLSAGTTISDLRTSNRHAKSTDKHLEALARDLQVEDDALQDAIEKGRLESWWKAVVDAVKFSGREDADQQGADAARRAKIKTELEGKMSLANSGKRLVNGDGAHVTNGVNMDEQGDVVME